MLLSLLIVHYTSYFSCHFNWTVHDAVCFADVVSGVDQSAAAPAADAAAAAYGSGNPSGSSSRLRFSFVICHKISINWINLPKAQLQMRSKRQSGMQYTVTVVQSHLHLHRSRSRSGSRMRGQDAGAWAAVSAGFHAHQRLLQCIVMTTPVPPRRS